ncbi:MAG TPA: SPASM domain-containing protein [bacterium]|nr:SPASM domain-containing protein [bacterium]
MRTLAILMTSTNCFRRPFSDGEQLLTRFGGQSVLAHVTAALRQVSEIERTLILLPPEASAALRAECTSLDLTVPACGSAPYTTDLALHLADEAGAEELLLLSAHTLLVDPALTREMLARHRQSGAAETLTALPRMAPFIISMAAVRRIMQEQNTGAPGGTSILEQLVADPQRYAQDVVPLPGPDTPDVTTLNFLHPAQEPAFAALWAAAGGRGAAAVRQYVAEHAAAFTSFPRWAQVEVTSRCNQACPVCPHARRNVQTDLADGAFSRIVDGLAWNTGVAGIDIAGFGEPLLHPGLRDFIDRATARQLELFLYTNGTLWDRSWSEFVLAPERQLGTSGLRGIVFTINGTTPEAYRAFHGTDDLARVRRAVKELLLMKRERGLRLPVVAVQIVKCTATDTNIEAFWQEWNFAERFERQRWPDYDHAAEQSQLRLQTITIEREDSSSAQQEAKLAALHTAYQSRRQDAFYRHAELPLEHVVIQRCNDYAGQLPDLRVVDYTPLQRFACRQAAYGLMVLADGTVTACQQDFNGTMALGNLHERDLPDLWNDPRCTALRHAQQSGDYATTPLCAACRDWFIPMV